MSIAAAELANFESLGYAAGIRVAGAAAVERYRQGFNEVEEREGRAKCQRGLFDLHFTVPFVWELAAHPKILDSVEATLGPDLWLMGSHFFCKYGPTEAFVAWHQDVTYWGLEPQLAVSAWYAVDDSNRDNGCMQVIPGSHREGVRGHGESANPGANLLSINQELAVSPEEAATAANIELAAGEVSLHHGLTIHGSPPNRSSRRRCGLAMIYLPTHVRQAAANSRGIDWPAVLVRGEDRFHHFPARPKPFSSPAV